jgi:hypothetical protein
VVGDLLLVVVVGLRAIRQHHVVDPLEGGADDRGVAAHDLEVVLERAGPVEVRVFLEVLELGDAVDEASHGLSGLLTRFRSGASVP